jgi:hypothetical protein
LIHGKTRDNKNKGYEKPFFMKMLGKIYEKVSRDTKNTRETKNRRDTKKQKRYEGNFFKACDERRLLGTGVDSTCTRENKYKNKRDTKKQKRYE